MQDVMRKAQELAEAIAESNIYQNMKKLENELMEDEAAAGAVQKLAMKRQEVEDLLGRKDMDPNELMRLNQEMVQAEKVMNSFEKVKTLKEARKEFTDMMDNVNRILRLVITGEIREDDVKGGCSGDCSSCSGCS